MCVSKREGGWYGGAVGGGKPGGAASTLSESQVPSRGTSDPSFPSLLGQVPLYPRPSLPAQECSAFDESHHFRLPASDTHASLRSPSLPPTLGKY